VVRPVLAAAVLVNLAHTADLVVLVVLVEAVERVRLKARVAVAMGRQTNSEPQSIR